MNHMYAYSRDNRKIKFRMASVQHFINEAPDISPIVALPPPFREHRGSWKQYFLKGGVLRCSWGAFGYGEFTPNLYELKLLKENCLPHFYTISTLYASKRTFCICLSTCL